MSIQPTVVDAEKAPLLTAAQHEEVRRISQREYATSKAVHRSNFHLAATHLAFAKSRTCQSYLVLFASVFIMYLQTNVVIAVTAGVDKNSCLSNEDCLMGLFCAAAEGVDLAGTSAGNTMRRCTKCRTPGFCAGENNAASFTDWRAAQELQSVGSVGHTLSDYESHCAACFDGAEYKNSREAQRLRVANMRSFDKTALLFATIFVALAIANELHDVQICALVRRQANADGRRCSWANAVLWLVEALRRFVVLPYLSSCIQILTLGRGADALSICFNAVAVLFILEIDNQIYAHGMTESFREWCESHARPEMSDAEQRVIDWSRAAGILAVWLGVFGSVLMRASAFGEAPGSLIASLVTILVPLLAEVAGLGFTRKAAIRTGELLLQLIVASAIGLGLQFYHGSLFE